MCFGSGMRVQVRVCSALEDMVMRAEEDIDGLDRGEAEREMKRFGREMATGVDEERRALARITLLSCSRRHAYVQGAVAPCSRYVGN